MKTFLRDLVTTLALAAIIYAGLQATFQTFVVDGPSMRPTFQHGQRLLVNKAVYRFREPKRGEVIVFHPPNNQQNDYIKRIIGLPGESVEISEGRVYIHRGNREVWPLDEPYIREETTRSFWGDVIPKDEYFVLGDNRNNSEDSRAGWTLPRQNIIGKAFLSIWPPEKWGLAPNYLYEEARS